MTQLSLPLKDSQAIFSLSEENNPSTNNITLSKNQNKTK